MVAKTLTLQLNQPTPRDPATSEVSIDDSVRLPDSAPTACLTINPSVLGDTSLATNFNIPAVITNLQSFKNGVSATAVLSSQQISNTSLTAINTYLTNLLNVDYPKLQQAANCVVEKTSAVDSSELQAQKQVTEESKSRLAAITAPETHVSYYESWFPRPMKQEAFFGLFGTALFLLLVSVAFFLGMGGIQFQIIFPTWGTSGIDFSFLTSRTPILFAGLGVGLILGVVGHYLKLF